LDRAKKDGRILHTGFSFHGDKDNFKEIVDAYDWDVCQIQYNFLDEENQAGTEGLAYAAARGLGVIVMEPLRGGNLARKVPPEVQAIWDEADVKRTPAEWALRWVWNRPEVSVVLSGMNEESHVEENLRIADEAYPDSLTAKELELVSRVEKTYRTLMKMECTGCGYCQPCPEGVDIPACFEIYNNKHLFGDKRADLSYNIRLSGVSGKPSKASLCTECGACEELCPQHIPIPELLKDVAAEFESNP
jgi:predicted aldo/keto reductase-like oxidoreductase